MAAAKGKKGGFKGMECPFTKKQFLAEAKDITVEMTLKPRLFANGRFGFQKAGGIMKVVADGPNGHGLGEKAAYTQPSCTAHVKASKKGADLLCSEEFMREATPFKESFVLHPHEFKPGSFGWYTSQSHDVMVGGKQLRLQLVFNAPIRKSKERADAEVDPKVPVVASGGPLAIIPGVGPMTEQELITAGINTIEDAAAQLTTGSLTHAIPRIERIAQRAQEILTGEQDPLVTEMQLDPFVTNEQQFRTRQAEGYTDVVMKSLVDGRNICKIQNDQIIDVVEEKGDSYVVRWNNLEGLVKKTNIIPASIDDMKAESPEIRL